MDPLKKIKSMTSSFGIYQHGKLNKPEPEFGYAIEDQARALIVVDEFKDIKLQNIYLNFIKNAQRKDGLLHHFYFYNNGKSINNGKGQFRNEEYNSKPNVQEAYGLTLWSLLATNVNKDDDLKKIIKNLVKDSYNWTFPRPISSALLGLSNLNQYNSLVDELKIKLHNFYFNSCSDDWEWFENYLVYANAIIPWALWEVYLKRKCKISFDIAKKTTDFLIANCQENNFPAPIGCNGWYIRGKNKALFDQQPIDAGYMVCCLEKAYYATKENFYLNWAEKWYKWFSGNNIKDTSLIDENFACYDGLSPKGVNLNQGAESNICFLMAYLAARRLGITK